MRRCALLFAPLVLFCGLFAAIACATSITFTAVGSGYYRVMLDGAQYSQHVTEREALESLANLVLADPAADAYLMHDYRVEATTMLTDPTPPEVCAPETPPGPGQLTVSWTAPTARSDGTALPIEQIGGYKLYYGMAPGAYLETIDIPGPATTTATVEVPPGVYYLVMTTYDTEGRESGYSPEISKTAQ